MKLYSIALAAAVFLAVTSAAEAGQIVVSSYDMLNGDGQASGGQYNYWDANYNGSGCTTCENAPLNGGTGALTDGYIEHDIWSNVSNIQGTGPYVGWETQYTGNPTVTFNFAGNQTITSIDIYVDNSNFGGVGAPASFIIDGNPYTAAVTNISNYAQKLTITGLFTGSSLVLTANAGSEPWIFISEIQFFDNVPEPGSLALLGMGFLGFGGLAGRRRRNATVTL